MRIQEAIGVLSGIQRQYFDARMEMVPDSVEQVSALDMAMEALKGLSARASGECETCQALGDCPLTCSTWQAGENATVGKANYCPHCGRVLFAARDDGEGAQQAARLVLETPDKLEADTANAYKRLIGDWITNGGCPLLDRGMKLKALNADGELVEFVGQTTPGALAAEYQQRGAERATRCEECQYWTDIKASDSGKRLCDRLNIGTYSRFFCSYGYRREGAQEGGGDATVERGCPFD